MIGGTRRRTRKDAEPHGDNRIRPARSRTRSPRSSCTGCQSAARGWIDWVTTTDHKKIGILYLFTTAFFFLVGGVEALLMRIQLGSPDNTFLDPTTYNQLFTMHGTTMIFMVVVPIAAGFGNYLVPLMIGARDMAFPRLNMLSWWLLVAGGVGAVRDRIFWDAAVGRLDLLHAAVGHDFLAGTRHRRLDPGPAPRRHLLDPRRDQLHRDDPQHARPGHEPQPHAAVRLDDPDLLVPDHASRSARSPRRSRCC